MCASVCPSQALYFGTCVEIETLRPNSRPIHTFVFGHQVIRTRVNLMVPKTSPVEQVDVVAAMYEPTIGNNLEEDLFLGNTVPAEARA